MNRTYTRISASICLALVIATGCSTMVKIETNVPGARIFVNNEMIGRSPATKTLTNFDFTTFSVRIEEDGYGVYQNRLEKELKPLPIVGGFFLWPFWLWSYGPVPKQYFTLAPLGAEAAVQKQSTARASTPRMNSERKLSVMEFQIDPKTAPAGLTGQDMALWTETFISKTGTARLVNRTNLREVLTEKELAGSDLFNADMNVKLGNFDKADFLLIGQVKKIGDGYSVFMKLIDLETNMQGAIFEKAGIYPATSGINGFRDAVRELVDEMRESGKL